MKLVVRDVSALLNVSEKTVYQWIAKRNLPAHCINDQYRFNRIELLDWAMAKHLPLAPDILGKAHPDDPCEFPGIAEALRTGGVFYHVPGGDKAAVLAKVVRIMSLPAEVDRDFLLEVLLARESLCSTGIGDGVAIPHVRNPIVMHVPRPIMSLSFLEQRVEFDALDGRPVHTLFTIVSSTIHGHLQLLSRLSFAMRQPDFKAAIARKAPREELLQQAEAIDRTVAVQNLMDRGNLS
ncbi:MAG TPA: PTS sugar transporter subunit IIA [Anaerolineae bacterium]|nr:PTS sugar transporter subunit IIA [Anaerolineae bacterium]